MIAITIKGVSLAALLPFCAIAVAAPPASQPDSELKEVREKIRILQDDPLAKDALERRQCLTLWFINNKTFEVKLCPSLLGSVLQADKNKEPGLYVAHMMFGSGAYMIDNPGSQADTVSIYLAGVDAALDVYQKVGLKRKKMAIPFMDELLMKRNTGTLRNYLVDEVAKCK